MRGHSFWSTAEASYPLARAATQLKPKYELIAFMTNRAARAPIIRVSVRVSNISLKSDIPFPVPHSPIGFV